MSSGACGGGDGEGGVAYKISASRAVLGTLLIIRWRLMKLSKIRPKAGREVVDVKIEGVGLLDVLDRWAVGWWWWLVEGWDLFGSIRLFKRRVRIEWV